MTFYEDFGIFIKNTIDTFLSIHIYPFHGSSTYFTMKGVFVFFLIACVISLILSVLNVKGE